MKLSNFITEQDGDSQMSQMSQEDPQLGVRDSRKHWMHAIELVSNRIRQDHAKGSVPRQELQGAATTLSVIFPRLPYDQALRVLRLQTQGSHGGDSQSDMQPDVDVDTEQGSTDGDQV